MTGQIPPHRFPKKQELEVRPVVKVMATLDTLDLEELAEVEEQVRLRLADLKRTQHHAVMLPADEAIDFENQDGGRLGRCKVGVMKNGEWTA